MEKFNFNKEQNSVEDFTENKSESTEDGGKIKRKEKIEDIRNEEKEFLGGIKEYARNVFHFVHKNYKENFKKILRVATLATVLSIPVGEKVFTEREEKLTKESTVAMAQTGQEAIKEDTETEKYIVEQRELIKEKYAQKILTGKGFSLEELQDFEDALEEIKTFSPDKFSKLKIILVKADNSLFNMKAMPNFCKKFDTIKDIELKIDPDKKSENIDFMVGLLILEKENYAQHKTDTDDYDVIICSHKKRIKKDTIESDTYAGVSAVTSIQKKDTYKNIYIHELSHLITLNDNSMYKELDDKFKEINKKIDGYIMIVSSVEDINSNSIARYPGFVSVYAGGRGQEGITFDYHYKYKYNERNNTYEDTAETLTYMIKKYHYADDDLIVQEKIKIIKDFLNEKTDN
ncbi:hypothetical protein COT82_01160 [Candidatus Campbellbacteria bacterium CG10_big_fil_rev_8_21_14_0_10_35_52]|uniref:Uncharacterized protein n=1 Tax=Candidatus Campbellbacteria bacterium CG10_big_fil_rev_8_21_14_0_10_35_52 TaxID=1974527 RepID=A0A2M6WVL2_9BACT|nr:MAG: hypothetical protein COT82_01160 [Candidatus Campbellbacteria bacterium CG10_big_fil_rev_8_21_14_0_10_35_52]